MVVLWILFGLLALIGLLLALPLRIFLQCDDELHYQIKYGLIPIYDSDKPRKRRSEPTKKSPTQKKKKKRSVLTPLLDFFGLSEISSFANIKRSIETYGIVGTIEIVSREIKRLLLRSLRLVQQGKFKKFRLSILVGDEDSGDAAVAYGQVCAVTFPLLSYLSGILRFCEQKVDIRCDYTLEQTVIRFDGQLNYRTWHIVSYLAALSWNYIKNSSKKE